MIDGGDDSYEIHDEKCAVIVVMDVSDSMRNEIGSLEKEFNEFVLRTKKDEYLSHLLDLAVITFGSDVRDEFGFCDVNSVPELELRPRGTTNMTEALELADDMAMERVRYYESNGISASTPWIVLIAGSCPDCRDTFSEIVKVLRNRNVHLLAGGIGHGYDDDFLLEFTRRCLEVSSGGSKALFNYMIDYVRDFNPILIKCDFEKDLDGFPLRQEFFDE